MAKNTIKIPEPIVAKCQGAIGQLQDLKVEIEEKKTNIQEQDQHFESRLKKVAAHNKSLKVDTKQKNALQNDCERYQKALDALITDINNEVAQYNLLLSPDAPLKLEKPEDLFVFAFYVKRQINGTKKFIKKVKKDVAIAHSRFSFGFDMQQKELNVVEWVGDRK